MEQKINGFTWPLYISAPVDAFVNKPMDMSATPNYQSINKYVTATYHITSISAFSLNRGFKGFGLIDVEFCLVRLSRDEEKVVRTMGRRPLDRLLMVPEPIVNFLFYPSYTASLQVFLHLNAGASSAYYREISNEKVTLYIEGHVTDSPYPSI